jgi:hypothetical protein
MAKSYLSESAPKKETFSGKHSKDGSLSLFLQKRQVHEYCYFNSAVNDSSQSQPEDAIDYLNGIVRIDEGLLLHGVFTKPNADKAVWIQVSGHYSYATYDFTIHFNEHMFYSSQHQLYPKCDTVDNPRFQPVLHDPNYLPFSVALSPGLPPSVMFYPTPLSCRGTYRYLGIVYTIRAWIGPREYSPSLQQSSAFFSFKKSILSAPHVPRPLSLPYTQASRFFIKSCNVTVTAVTDKYVYHEGETIKVKISIRNESPFTVKSIRLVAFQKVVAKMAPLPEERHKSIIGSTGMGGTDNPIPLIKKGETRTVSLSFTPGPTQSQYERLAVEPNLDPNITYPRISPSFVFQEEPMPGANLEVLSVEYYLKIQVGVSVMRNVKLKLPFALVNNATQDSS